MNLSLSPPATQIIAWLLKSAVLLTCPRPSKLQTNTALSTAVSSSRILISSVISTVLLATSTFSPRIRNTLATLSITPFAANLSSRAVEYRFLVLSTSKCLAPHQHPAREKSCVTPATKSSSREVNLPAAAVVII